MSFRTIAVERLERAILADRDDVELYLVYADELQRNGDPRGELMVMQNQIQSVEDRIARRALQRTCDKWIERHDLLGPLRDFPAFGAGRTAEVTSRFGFIRCLEIGWGPEARETPASATATLTEILQHPSSPWISKLVVGPAPGDGTMDMQCLVDALVAAAPRALRSLHLGRTTGWPRQHTTTGNIADANAALGRLQQLTLEGGTVRIGALALPELVELRVLCGVFAQDTIDELCAMSCPKLKTLMISFGEAFAAPDTLEARLRSHLPHVRKVRARGEVRDW
ncbi:MAG: TIGR02996 domain-containing protein [Deltaproteobacteria bacterium]|nr:TIGR02996 domain-containing protein [Deltaproteobacteria bacterium]